MANKQRAELVLSLTFTLREGGAERAGARTHPAILGGCVPSGWAPLAASAHLDPNEAH